MPVYYAPIVIQPKPPGGSANGKRGCSLSSGNTHYEDIGAIGASWWHNWGPSSGQFDPTPGFVATAWGGTLPYDIGADVILWCNEPNNSSQAGANPNLLDPKKAAQIFAQQRLKYGHRLWPAGVATPNDGWFDRFVDALATMGEAIPSHIHAHGYAEAALNMTVDDCIAFWEHLHSIIPAPGDVIISEFGSTDGDPGKVRAFVDWFEATPWIVKYALFSNRVDDTASWYPSHWPKPYPGNIVNPDGTLTSIGIEYCKVPQPEYNNKCPCSSR